MRTHGPQRIEGETLDQYVERMLTEEYKANHEHELMLNRLLEKKNVSLESIHKVLDAIHPSPDNKTKKLRRKYFRMGLSISCGYMVGM